MTALTLTADDVGDWVHLCALDDLQEDEVAPFEIAEQRIALYLVEGQVYATDNVCSHAFALLSDGWLEGDLVECPLHGALFDVKTGEAVKGPADCAIAVFPVKIENGQVSVRLPS